MLCFAKRDWDIEDAAMDVGPKTASNPDEDCTVLETEMNQIRYY